MEDFFRPKIVYGQFQDGAEYSFAEPGIFLSSNEYLLIVREYSAKCLLAFLNSKVSEWLLSKITGNLGDNAKIGQKSNFLKLSVAILSQDEQRFFEGKVDELLSNPDSQKNIETDIDKAIYRVYGLLIDEIQFITKKQVDDLVKIIRDSKTLVFGYGLMSNFMGELFETVSYMLPFVTKIVEIPTVCEVCGDAKATMNILVDESQNKNGGEIIIGNHFKGVCLKCFLEHKEK